jgi:hypothetical protein
VVEDELRLVAVGGGADDLSAGLLGRQRSDGDGCREGGFSVLSCRTEAG